MQWVPLFGFGSVLTILMAIFGVGIGLWRNASIAYRNINDKIEWTRAKPHPGTRASRPQPYSWLEEMERQRKVAGRQPAGVNGIGQSK